ncbi:CRISPR-associated endoribonuclease Cas6 [Agrilactobacillus fermenti]|uniref:CRISPR-associated endoribonuclease Cas6 n=1 Tax=Agrilactobacillus fermenti TaxID=2586909 RepID=UPI001E284D52|nr:CRISPR-associated endoribonuclease Cas6 [Agrilactobacillus fermenti]MCD2257203.1 CRISPR-associated endoribonuclease Cas6 [Agrilactobacillus fermenti]
MRFVVEAQLKHGSGSTDKVLVTQYFRSAIVSLIKQGIQATNISFYHELFDENKLKLYTFAVYFDQGKFKGDTIETSGHIKINISALDEWQAVNLYNAFVYLKQSHQNQHPFHNRFDHRDDDLQISILSIQPIREPHVESDRILVKTASPIIAREKVDIKKDFFVSATRDEAKFKSLVQENLKLKLGDYVTNKTDLDKFEIQPVEMKKTVIRMFDKCVEASTGRLLIQGPTNILEMALKCGLGSKTGSGAGFIFKI